MKNRFLKFVLKSQKGAYMVFFALLFPFLLGVIGFAIDAGFLYMQKAKLQDVADALALAGAAHLNDDVGIRDANVRKAVRAYAEANGFKEGPAGSNFVYLNDKQKADDIIVDKKEAWKIAQTVDTNVTDKDGVSRNHVRVVVVKRVPTFFIGILLPDQRNGVVVRATAGAEYVRDQGNFLPKVFCNKISNYGGTKSIELERIQDFSIFTDTSNQSLSTFIPDGSTGTLYITEKPLGNIPDGWNLVLMNGNINDSKTADIIDKVSLIKENKERTYQGYVNFAYGEKSNYIKGVGNKRYIGYTGTERIVVNNIQEGDDNIDLYVDATFGEISDEHYVILTNSQLRGVTKVKNLIFGKDNSIGVADYRNNIISTTGVDYGNIYSVYSSGNISISGKGNYFSGIIYTPGLLRVGGVDNWFNVSSSCEFFADTVQLGKWFKVVSNYIPDIGKDRILSVTEADYNYDNDKKIHWGNYQSNDVISDSASKWHTRLVY